MYLVPEHAPEDPLVRRHTHKHCAAESLLQTRWPPERSKLSLFQLAVHRNHKFKKEIEKKIIAYNFPKSMQRGQLW